MSNPIKVSWPRVVAISWAREFPTPDVAMTRLRGLSDTNASPLSAPSVIKRGLPGGQSRDWRV